MFLTGWFKDSTTNLKGNFKNNHFLIYWFRRGELIIYSDNIVSLSHMREFISVDATKRNIQLSIHADVSRVSTTTLLDRVHRKLLELVSQQDQITLSKALQDAVTEQLAQDSAEDWITEQFRHILEKPKEENISHQTIEQHRSTNKLQFLSSYKLMQLRICNECFFCLGFLLDLYASHMGFLGYSSTPSTVLSSDLLSTISTEALIQLFKWSI